LAGETTLPGVHNNISGMRPATNDFFVFFDANPDCASNL
jgi:hypothetical protein